jgi:hypothetical protein
MHQAARAMHVMRCAVLGHTARGRCFAQGAGSGEDPSFWPVEFVTGAVLEVVQKLL